MRCHVCDKTLTESEIIILPDKTFDCCSVCLEVALDAAYCDGFTREDPLVRDPEFEEEFGTGEVEILDEPDLFRTAYDHCDPSFVDGGEDDQ